VILIPTGGTTNGIKLAIHTWETLEVACTGVQQFLGGDAIDSCCVLPLYHVSGLMQLLRAYHSGGYIRFDEDIVEGRCLSYVPTQLRRALLDKKRTQALTTTRVIFVGGAPMSESLAEEARELKLPVMPVYGMTETAAMVAAIPVDIFLADSRAGALPIGDTNIEIDSSGRIRVQSPALFIGYHGGESLDLTRGYLTEDEGYIDEKGRLHVTGRIDRLVISGGEKIDPREVEDALSAIAGIEEVMALGLPDPEWGQKLVVYYTGEDLVDWKERLKEQLATYKLPQEMLRVDRLPLDEKGKFLRPS
jgi:O-succinylbenzoic acid--CoA ligase